MVKKCMHLDLGSWNWFRLPISCQLCWQHPGHHTKESPEHSPLPAFSPSGLIRILPLASHISVMAYLIWCLLALTSQWTQVCFCLSSSCGWLSQWSGGIWWWHSGHACFSCLLVFGSWAAGRRVARTSSFCSCWCLLAQPSWLSKPSLWLWGRRQALLWFQCHLGKRDSFSV